MFLNAKKTEIMFINHCSDIKVFEDEDAKISTCFDNNNSEASSPFKNVTENDFSSFDDVFKQNYDLMKSHPH